MAAERSATLETSERPSPLLKLTCQECGYGASVRRTPEQCPMCGEQTWISEGWKPFTHLA